MGSPSCSSNEGTVERGPAGAGDAGTSEEGGRLKRICRIVHANDKSKGLSDVQNEMGRLMHHDEQELLSVREGWHWDDNKGGWLDLEACAQARREDVEYIRRHTMYTRVSRETCLRETGRALIKTGWAETDKGQQGEAQRGCEVRPQHDPQCDTVHNQKTSTTVFDNIRHLQKTGDVYNVFSDPYKN